MRRVLAVAIVIAAALGLCSCESNDPIPVPSHSQVVGTWTHGSSILTLDADNSFSLVRVPTGVVKQTFVKPHHGPKGPDVSVSGTWKIGSGGNDAGGAPGVQLDFTRRIGAYGGLTLLVSGYTPSTRELYVNLGNPDSNIEYAYTKQHRQN